MECASSDGRQDAARHRGRNRAAVALLPAVAGVLLASAVAGPPADRLDGEQGLWVEVTRDSLHVAWLTAGLAAGQLEVLGSREASPTEGRAERSAPVLRTRTAAAQVHRVSLRRPPGQELVLRYGAADGEDGSLHETRIRLAPPRRPPVEVPAVDSLYVFGDTHGDYDGVVQGLRAAGLVDDALRWTGGRRHVVFAGDLMDRGPGVVQLLWLVYRLEHEAERSGGRVHVLLGNHEIMVMLGDLRYVHPGELHVAELHGVRYDRMFDIRRSVLGQWLATRPAAMRIGRVLVAHGGVSPAMARSSLRALDDTLATYMREELFYRWADSTANITIDSATYQRREDFFWGSESVFWHRAYLQADSTGPELEQVLRRLRADMLVVGHTAVQGIHARHDGRLIAAHTPRFGAELLLLVNEAGRLRRFRVNAAGTEEF